ncbi:endochitinase A-like [Pygocentrus nattereri]|uniref:Ig-like domain-containing protein n=1 Tax=Pygocentrus nattereri TaxID=42514 RepID=A0AAR2L719_PYGNA|nr:endochitinase A-like [Pygocentrus nattereri]XP_037399359.1 endochitinase A-like [Pygocentrus nattereri]
MDKAGMTLKILLIFTLFLISVGGGESERVTGYSGGGVLIKCRYERRYTLNPKYLCTGPWPCMTKPIWTDAKNEWINSGRFSLFDDTRAAQFWVMIRELTVEDSGTYQCGVHKYLVIDVYTPVELKVEEDPDYKKSISVTGHVGRRINISCKYSQAHSSYSKFLCRMMDNGGCYKTSVDESRRWINEGNLSLHDDRAKKIFTVVINRLTERDSGEYWCGAESDWTSGLYQKVYITLINLRVTEPPATSSSPSPSSSTLHITETTSSTASTATMSPSFKTSTGPDVLPQSSTHISSPTTKPTTSSTSKPSPSPLSATEFPVSSVVTCVSVILALLLIGLLFFILFLRNGIKTQASTQSQSHNGFSNNRKNSLAVYEDIQDICSSDTGVFTIYSTARLPTNPSEPSQTVYDNVRLPSSCDFSKPFYSQVIYSTAQLPTIPSDSSASVTHPSAGKSAEGPTYATVNFSKYACSSTDAVPMATINKESDSCDYATVKL